MEMFRGYVRCFPSGFARLIYRRAVKQVRHGQMVGNEPIFECNVSNLAIEFVADKRD